MVESSLRSHDLDRERISSGAGGSGLGQGLDRNSGQSRDDLIEGHALNPTEEIRLGEADPMAVTLQHSNLNSDPTGGCVFGGYG